MGFLDAIIGGGIGKLVKDVVGTFKLSPEARLEFDTALAAQAHELAMKDRELEAKLAEFQAKEIEAASANIRAESASGDKYTSRARPTFIYMVIATLGWNFIALPLFGRSPMEIPENILWLFGSCVLGYTGARTWDKFADTKRKAGL